ncbi:MAG: DUF2191 domain-containing protein [Gammaproteobacteria bacterium]|nr:DUF2191 domain-containing protein [Gammaproteobacteria bacterium]
MVCHMKTTLNIDGTVMTKLREEAARRGSTMSALVEAGLRLVLQSDESASERKLPALPRLSSGGELVDVADRDALLQAMDER